jgi:predicted nucleic acid-binding protein
MCVIIDANVASRVFAVPCEDDFAPLWDWIGRRNGRLVFGGENATELGRLTKVRARVREMWRAGQALEVGRTYVDAEMRTVARLAICRSNDPHVIALARASGARILCTNDQDLESDFKNLALVPRPKGKIYKNASHERLLGHNSICIRRPQ